MLTVHGGLLSKSNVERMYSCRDKVVVKTQGENDLDRPQTPRISCDRPDKVYASDESIIFSCGTTDREHSNGTFQLYNDGQLVNEKQSQRNSETFIITNGGDAPRDYYCVYTRTVSGRSMSSGASDKIKITVVDRPQTPRISCDRSDKVYASDESIIFSCGTTDREHSNGNFQLYNDGELVNEMQSQRYSETFTITNGGDAPRDYYCVYTRTVSGRSMSSGASDKIKITVVDRPQTPRISCDRSDKVYASDESIIFSCGTTDREHSNGNFQLYNDGELVNEMQSQRYSETFTITNGGDAPRDYYCVYTRTVSGRSMSSGASDKIKITVVARPQKPRISSDRPDKVYVSDESVILTCRKSNREYYGRTFRLYNGRQLVNEKFSYGSSSATFNITNGGDAPRDYYCVYTSTVSGRSISSVKSDRIKIAVVARPQKPRISSDRPDKVYVSDESVILTCRKTNQEYYGRTFHLYNGRQLVNEEFSYQSSATFNIANGGDAPRDYYCVYTRTVSGRRILSGYSNRISWVSSNSSSRSLTESLRSCISAQLAQMVLSGRLEDSLDFHVRYPEQTRPQKPQISSNRPDEVYVSDESVILTCQKTDQEYSGDTFRLYNDGLLVKEKLSQQNSATFTFANGGVAPWDYSCDYTRTVSGRTISSPESNRIKITVVARPQKPQISSNRPDEVYVSDESVILTCQKTDQEYSGDTFRLYNDGLLVKEKLSQRNSATFTFANGGVAPWDYSCDDTRTVSGRTISSPESNRIKITVVARPQKPQISSNRPDEVYVSDESVILTCQKTDQEYSGDTFRLYNNGLLVKEKLSQQNSATFTFANGGVAPWDYSCVYTRTVSGRTISSPESNRIKITVVDLPRPNISQVPSHVSQGEDVTFNCTFTKSTSVGTFYFYKNGVQLNDTVPQSADAQNKSATFTIQNVEPGNSGNYTCVYQLLKGPRNLMSAPSDAVFLSVHAKSFQPWIPALPVVALVLMFGVLGVYCWKKGKSRGREEFRAVPPPNDSPNSNVNVVYADLKLTARTKKQKGKKERFETHADDSTVYADIKL
ncbi:uncharacterized protein [Hemitrygon akajei]|uniref:uncharacterized protein n=1 Tax=Hemitrygon akajei TaxID=2704970 RepID=UPI003BFA0839